MRVFTEWEKVAQSCPTLRSDGLYGPWNSPGQNTAVSSLSLFQGIFPTQVSSLPAEPPGKQRILEWVAHPFSNSGSSGPRNQTRVSCIAGGFFTNWVIREALQLLNAETNFSLNPSFHSQNNSIPKFNKFFQLTANPAWICALIMSNCSCSKIPLMCLCL